MTGGGREIAGDGSGKASFPAACDCRAREESLLHQTMQVVFSIPFRGPFTMRSDGSATEETHAKHGSKNGNVEAQV